jgi:acetolactate synthase-1/2/3 large subunit
MEEMIAGDVIVQALKAAGVDTVFGIISIHNIPIYDAIARQGGIRAIPTRSEPGAVNMADGYSRASGKLGVAITSTGAGAGNASGSLVEAQTAGSSVLHLTGQIDSAHVDKGRGYIHECKDQLSMLKAISKAAYRPVSASAIPNTLHLAIQQALSMPRGVVSVELPIDYQKAKIVAPLGLPYGKVEQNLAPDPAALKQAAEILQQARRPLIWAGGGVLDAEASTQLIELAEYLGAGVFTSQSGRGSIPEDHPLCLGNFASNPAVRPLLQGADVLLLVGSHMRGNETNVWSLPMPTKVIQIDVDPLAIGRSYPATLGLIGDAKATLRALCQTLDSERAYDKSYRDEIAEYAKTARAKLRSSLGPYEKIVDELNSTLPRNAIKVRDVTISGTTWGSRIWNVYEPRTTIHASGGGIGQGMQMALGAKLAKPDQPVVAVVGDGGFMVNCGELATAVQEQIPVVILLFNDGGYGVLRNIQNRGYEGRNFAVNLRTPDFVKMAEAFGAWSSRVQNVADFKPTLQEALSLNRPALIEIDMASIGDFAEPFAGPVGAA